MPDKDPAIFAPSIEHVIANGDISGSLRETGRDRRTDTDLSYDRIAPIGDLMIRGQELADLGRQSGTGSQERPPSEE